MRGAAPTLAPPAWHPASYDASQHRRRRHAFLVFRQPLPRLHRRPKTKDDQRLRGDAQTLTEDVYSDAGDWSDDGIILFCKQNFGPISQIRSLGWARYRQPLVSTKTNLRIAPHLSFRRQALPLCLQPTRRANRIKVGVLGKARTRWNRDWPRRSCGICFPLSAFVRAGHIQAQPFNSRTFTLSGDPQTIGEARTFLCLSKTVFSPTTKFSRVRTQVI